MATRLFLGKRPERMERDAGSFQGEYQAGRLIVVLDLHREGKRRPAPLLIKACRRL